MASASLDMIDDRRCLQFELPYINANNFPALHALLLIVWRQRVRIDVNGFLGKPRVKELSGSTQIPQKGWSAKDTHLPFPKPLSSREVILPQVMSTKLKSNGCGKVYVGAIYLKIILSHQALKRIQK